MFSWFYSVPNAVGLMFSSGNLGTELSTRLDEVTIPFILTIKWTKQKNYHLFELEKTSCRFVFVCVSIQFISQFMFRLIVTSVVMLVWLGLKFRKVLVLCYFFSHLFHDVNNLCVDFRSLGSWIWWSRRSDCSCWHSTPYQYVYVLQPFFLCFDFSLDCWCWLCFLSRSDSDILNLFCLVILWMKAKRSQLVPSVPNLHKSQTFVSLLHGTHVVLFSTEHEIILLFSYNLTLPTRSLAATVSSNTTNNTQHTTHNTIHHSLSFFENQTTASFKSIISATLTSNEWSNEWMIFFLQVILFKITKNGLLQMSTEIVSLVNEWRSGICLVFLFILNFFLFVSLWLSFDLRRRKRESKCFNGEQFERVLRRENCSCTYIDYEWYMSIIIDSHSLYLCSF